MQLEMLMFSKLDRCALVIFWADRQTLLVRCRIADTCNIKRRHNTLRENNIPIPIACMSTQLCLDYTESPFNNVA